jgi:hypothetical protein
MAAQTYFCTLTAVGEAKDANAKALGIALKFTEMALGDGNGALPIPDRMRTALVRINSMKTDPANPGQVIIEQVIPETEGGWWIRELGVYDADGDLVAIGNCPETYKPQLSEGSGRTQVVRMVLIMSSAATVTLKVDPSVVLATRKYVDDQDALHVAALDPHPQYLTEAEGAARIAAAVAALVNASPSTLDTLAELANALGNDQDFAAHMLAALALKAPLSSPSLTGNPTAPLAGQFDNDSSLATTQFVQRALGNFQSHLVLTAARILTPADVGKIVIPSLTGPYNVSLPIVKSVASGSAFSFLNVCAQTVTIFPQGTDVINVSNGSVASVALAPGETLQITTETNGWYVVGGSASLKYSAASFGASIVNAGYQRLPSGLIIQWGFNTFTPGGTAVFFPIAFPGGVNSVTFGAVGSAPQPVPSFATPNTGGFTGFASSNTPVTWMAVGF